MFILFYNADGSLKGHQKIQIDGTSQFGWGVDGIGDVDQDGTPDVIVGAPRQDGNRGSAFVILMNPDGTPKSSIRIGNGEGGLQRTLSTSTFFGSRVAGLGDIDGDGVPDAAVVGGNGAYGPGKLYLLFLNSDGTVKSSRLMGELGTTVGVSNLGDFDGNGVNDMIIGGANTARIVYLRSDGTVLQTKLLNAATTGLAAEAFGGEFGIDVAAIGDLDGDGITDIVSGARLQKDAGGRKSGGIVILFLTADGSAKDYRIIGRNRGGLVNEPQTNDWFGTGVAGLGDITGDGVVDILVGSPLNDRFGADKGAVYLLATGGVPVPAPGFSGPKSEELSVIVTINNVNEAPQFPTDTFAFSMPENTVDLSAQQPITVADVDAAYDLGQNTQGWALGGPDAASFTVQGGQNGATIEYVGVALDFEAKSSLELTITATDTGGLSTTADVIVSILDVNEAPTIASPPTEGETWSFDATAEVGTALDGRTFSPEDVDAGSSPFLEIIGCSPAAICDSISYDSASHELRYTQPLAADALFPASATFQVRARETSDDDTSLFSDAYDVQVVVGCDTVCPLGTVAIGSCSADGSATQSCYDPAAIGEAADGDGRVELEDSSVDGNSDPAPNGRLAIVPADTQTVGDRPRSGECAVTVQATWAAASALAAAVEPVRLFRLSAPGASRGGNDAPLNAFFALLSGETKTLSIPSLSDGEASTLRLQGLSSEPLCAQDGGVDGLAGLPDLCWTDADVTADVETRCFCETCGEDDAEEPATFKNPVCAADTLEALAIPAASSCLSCTTCSSSQYETRSCRATHPDDAEAIAVEQAIYTDRECTDCAQCAYDQYELVGCKEGSVRQDRVCESRLA